MDRIKIAGKALDVGAGSCEWDGDKWSPDVLFEGTIIRADKIKTEKINVQMDFDKKWPFNDNEFDIINASHTFEHSKEPFQFLDEAYRVLKSNGILYVRMPHVSNPLLFAAVDHMRGGATTTFNTTNKNKWEINHSNKARFDLKKMSYGMRFYTIFSPLVNLIGLERYEYFLATRLMPLEEIRFVLMAVKD
ncbi:MAG: class I SAM-dependent methyltransferase [Candidatus Diapherotrites archaeon]|nr:class I SAM-dependent methyltransferase [Candidatus Diapherotrites archaeon]